MANDLADLHARMDAAAAALDFEEARRLRDRISLLRAAGPDADIDDDAVAALTRQQPGAMGIGSDVARPARPPGWKPPPKPDPLTTSRKRR